MDDTEWFAVGVLALLVGTPSALASFAAQLRDPERTRYFQSVEKSDRFMVAIGRITTRLMRSREPEVRLVAIGAIGAFGYYSRMPVLDLYGLVDPVISRNRGGADVGELGIPGHERSDADYVLGRRPDYIFIRRRPEDSKVEVPGVIPASLDLWAHPDFDRLYTWDDETEAYRLRARPTG